MQRRIGFVARLFLVAAFPLLAVMLPTPHALGQTATPTPDKPTLESKVVIDTPVENAIIGNGTELNIGGWAVDPLGPGTGITLVRIYLDGPMGAGGRHLGVADFGAPRPDVAQSIGIPSYTNSGFNFTWTPSSLMPGEHTIYVYAQSRASGWLMSSVKVMLQGNPSASASERSGQMGPCITPLYGGSCTAPNAFPYPPPGIAPYRPCPPGYPPGAIC
jgi:hypothetical protein